MDEVIEGIPNQGTNPATAVPLENTEKLLKQSEVNELLGKAKHASYERGRREAMEAATQTQQQSMGGQSQVTEDQIRQMITDEAQRQTQINAAQHMLTSFGEQWQTGKGKYPDFDETVGNLGDLKNIPHIVQLATETGIAGDVMFELGRNPGKVASLTTLAYINPHLAKMEMKKLADSIKTNDQAKDSPSVAEPLSQVRPSSSVGADNGSNTVRDLRKKSWARA